MGWYLYDANGYVGDLASNNGFASLQRSLENSTETIADFFNEGWTNKLDDLKNDLSQEELKNNDDQQTLNNLIELIEHCEEIAIISDGLEEDDKSKVLDSYLKKRTKDAEFKEEDHPRGQPNNKGQFVKNSEKTTSQATPKTETQQPRTWFELGRVANQEYSNADVTASSTSLKPKPEYIKKVSDKLGITEADVKTALYVFNSVDPRAEEKTITKPFPKIGVTDLTKRKTKDTIFDRFLKRKTKDSLLTMSFQGLPIVIENPIGSLRKHQNGVTKMFYPYGYIKKTVGRDGDEIDCFIGPNEKATNVFIVKLGKDDKEDKVMMGFDDERQARDAFLAHYDDFKFLGTITAFPVEQFKKVLEEKGMKGVNLTKDVLSILGGKQ